MGGFLGVAARDDCVRDLFYGTDYHSHLGTRRGGLAVRNNQGLTRIIHNITSTEFRSKFEDDLGQLHGQVGIGVISDYEDQPLIINPASDRHRAMVDAVRKTLNLTSLRYQRLEDLVEAIGLPKAKLCTYCWNGSEG